MDRHNNFDLLRLLAALSVILSHAFLLAENSLARDPLMRLTGGQTSLGVAGVFVFFAISGYLISQSFAATRSPLAFLAKRGLRIFPGLIACLAVCAFAIGPVVTRLPLAAYLTQREPYLFVLRNAVLDVEAYNRLPGVSFWPGDIGGIVNGPLWSLPCEVLSYLLLFALGMCRLLTLPACLMLLAAGIAFLWIDTSAMLPEPLGSTSWLIGFFAAGMVCYRLRRTTLLDGRWALLAFAGLAASIPLGVFQTLFPLCGGYLTIWLALSRRLPVVPAARFGDLSYGLYIYGWPAEQCVLYASGGAAPWWAVFLIGAAVAVPLAFLSWHLVEKRCRYRARRAARPDLAAAGVAG